MAEKITLTIDGRTVSVEAGATVLSAAQEAGLYIPTLCYHPDLRPFGACRMCITEIEKMRGFPPACTTPATEGMVVQTNTEKLQELRRNILELILTEHPPECLVCWRRERCDPLQICLRTATVGERCVDCPKNQQCELQRLVDYVGIKEITLPASEKELPILPGGPFFDRDYNLCVLCGRCVQACQDLRGIGAIAFNFRGSEAVVGTAFDQSLEDSGCKFCFTCVEVCPTGALVDKAARFAPIEDWEAYVVPCRNACPAGVDVPRYVSLAAEGKYDESLAVVRERVPFPGSLGRVCVHPCEEGCRRSELNDPISIKAIKRYVADHGNGLWKQNQRTSSATGKKVAVVGAGPAGLTTAFYCAKKGHQVTVFEALPEAGGMMRVGIPEYRLPRDIISGEVDEIKAVGVDIQYNKPIESLEGLLSKGYDAVFLGLGSHQGMKLGVEGEDVEGVIESAEFLRRVNLGEKIDVGESVGIVGGGNVAIDAARVSLRLGAKKVSIFYRRTRAEMPANPEEIVAAIDEGIEMIYLAAPQKVTREGGKLSLECLRMKLGEPDASGRRSPVPIAGSEFTTELDTLIAAIGQRTAVPEGFGVETGRANVIKVDDSMQTSKPGVFSAGDCVSGPLTVIAAIAGGRQAASAIDKYLGGDGEIEEELVPRETPNPILGHDEGFAGWRRVMFSELPHDTRIKSFEEVDAAFTEGQCIGEANRCFRCHLRLEIRPVPLPPVAEKASA
jgi:NADPH-dependent glutamate synthase beta subunit-like oxidoreductase